MNLHFKCFASTVISAFFILCTHALAAPPGEQSNDNCSPGSTSVVSPSKPEVHRPVQPLYADMASSLDRFERALAEVQEIAPLLRARNASLKERIVFLETYIPWAECALSCQSESMDEKRRFLSICKDRVTSKLLSTYPHSVKKTSSGLKVMHYGSAIGFWLKQYRLCQQALEDAAMFTDTFSKLMTLHGENIRTHCDRKSVLADEYIFDPVSLTINLNKPEEDAIPGLEEGVYNLTNEIFHKIAFESQAGVFSIALERRAEKLEKSEVGKVIAQLDSLKKEQHQSNELLLRIRRTK